MKFIKTKSMIEVDNIMQDLDNCGDKYCGNIITSEQLKEEGHIFLKKVLKKCRSTKQPKTLLENKMQNKKYDTCFTKYKNGSTYYKHLTQRKKCEDKNCSIYQNRMQKKLSSVAKKNRRTKKNHGK